MWALLTETAQSLEREAQAYRKTAEGYRCTVMDSGGELRCTGDVQWEPDHEHRWRKEDLPDE